MKEKLRKIVKSRIFIFVCAALLFGSIGVSAATYFPSVDVTYDNKESGLVSTDVQGAIDELYVKAQQVSSGSDDKVEDMGGTTTSGGDGLYKDPYETGRYVFKGANPNNYITFNNEQAGWRIISLEPDGTIKIMKIASIGSRAYDDSSSNDWRNADLNTYLNDTYYNRLTATAKSQIVSHNFSVGAGYWDSNGNTSDLTDQVNAENEQLWNGKVGLATATEYLRSNSNTSNCRTVALINKNYNTCKSTTWMFNSANWWTMSASTRNTYGAFYVDSGGGVYGYGGGNTSYGVRPVLYLSSNVTLSGSGTQNDPYTLG